MLPRSAATLASWGLAIGILAILLWRADRPELGAALMSADLASYALITVPFVGLWLALDSFVLCWLFGRLNVPVRWAEMVRFRGATYLPMAVSFHLASAALVGVIHRRTGMPVARAAAAMLLLYAGDLAALTGVAFLASLGSVSPLLAAIRPLLAALCAGLVAVFAIGHVLRRRLAGRPFFGVVADLDPVDAASLIGLRAVFYASFILFVWLTLPAFELRLSLGAVASRLPIVMSIAALPITPGGLGTGQAAMVALFGELEDPSRVLAYAVVYGASLILFRLPIGAALAPGILRPRGRPRAREGA